MERKKREGFVKNEYVKETEGLKRRGKPNLGWKDMAKEYIHERVTEIRGGIELAKKGVYGQGEVEAVLP